MSSTTSANRYGWGGANRCACCVINVIVHAILHIIEEEPEECPQWTSWYQLDLPQLTSIEETQLQLTLQELLDTNGYVLCN